jgi:predicted nucleotidyltransferase
MQVRNKSDLFEALVNQNLRLRQFHVKRLGVFGSFARGDQNDESDIDFIVEFETDAKSFDNLMQLGFFLEETLGRKVELITPESLSPHIGPHILREVEYASIGA